MASRSLYMGGGGGGGDHKKEFRFYLANAGLGGGSAAESSGGHPACLPACLPPCLLGASLHVYSSSGFTGAYTEASLQASPTRRSAERRPGEKQLLAGSWSGASIAGQEDKQERGGQAGDFQPQEINEQRSVTETSKWSLKSFSDGSRIQHVKSGNGILDEAVASSSQRSVFTVEDDGWFLQTIATAWSCEGADIEEAEIPEVNTRDQELDVESFISSQSVQRPSTVQRRLHNAAADEEPSLGESSSFPGAETPQASVEDEGSEGDGDTSSPRVPKPKKWLIKRLLNTEVVEDSSSAECSSTDEDDTMYEVSSIEDEVWDSPPAPGSARNIGGGEEGRGHGPHAP
ncbi:uncharacterized protein LOC128350551 [Hemicordylus capensis]|uniref:uncharacterized protein LOC128350551 n=1 Tax=Hemicordylus capensis TaxID=884348 RepID=UPI002304BA84|nr:uncharacterized protein LOC128350551 [Hemicordylus capensis]